MKITVLAHAKVNLALKVVGRRGDGYHLLDSIVSEIGLADVVTVSKRQDKEVVVNTSIGVIEGDTSYKMAKMLVNRYDLSGVDVFVEKKIPFAAGLGGSSADAAGVYRAMKILFDFPDCPADVLATIGADVPFMVLGGAARMQGIGERIDKITLPKMDVAIVIADGSMTTQAVYRNVDEVALDSGDIDQVYRNLEAQVDGDYLFNDLEYGATDIDVRSAKQILRDCGYNLVAMTGSGNAVVGYSYKGQKKDVESLQARVSKGRLIIDRIEG